MKQSTLRIENQHNRFHQEIIDFSDWVRVRNTEPYQDFFEKVKQVIQEAFPNSHVVLFGSSASYLAVQGSDIDVLVYD